MVTRSLMDKQRLLSRIEDAISKATNEGDRATLTALYKAIEREDSEARIATLLRRSPIRL